MVVPSGHHAGMRDEMVRRERELRRAAERARVVGPLRRRLPRADGSNDTAA